MVRPYNIYVTASKFRENSNSATQKDHQTPEDENLAFQIITMVLILPPVHGSMEDIDQFILDNN